MAGRGPMGVATLGFIPYIHFFQSKTKKKARDHVEDIVENHARFPAGRVKGKEMSRSKKSKEVKEFHPDKPLHQPFLQSYNVDLSTCVPTVFSSL